MSIESQLTALAANKAAIKAAIEAKNPATAPTDALTQWPTSIASIPTGSSLDEIIAATTAMDGLSHTGATESQLAAAIKEITRRPAVTLAPASSWHPDAGKSAFVVRVVDDGAHGLQFTVGGAILLTGHSSYTIEWGDGTSSTVSQTGNIRTTHTYSAAGEYMVQISNDVSGWYPHFALPSGSYYSGNSCLNPQGSWSQVVVDGQTDGYWDLLNKFKIVRALQWGQGIRSSQWAYNGIVTLTGTPPPWGPNMDDLNRCFYNCCSLVGAAPTWTTTAHNCDSCFSGASITGQVPEWGENIVYANNCYQSCYGLTGRIPAWNSKITNASTVYQNCFGLTGTIPAWGAAITNANSTYQNCRGLTGTIPQWGANITSAGNTFDSCYCLTGAIPAWTNVITYASATFSNCLSVAGLIPAWGAAITNANNCFNGCRGLTGPWSSSATDAELMPSHITSHSNTFSNCEDRLRAYFLTSWGGTRAS